MQTQKNRSKCSGWPVKDGEGKLSRSRHFLFCHDQRGNQPGRDPVDKPVRCQVLEEAGTIHHGREASEQEPEEEREH